MENNNLIVLGFENTDYISMIVYDHKNMLKSILSQNVNDLISQNLK
jgi:hypothetical protein